MNQEGLRLKPSGAVLEAILFQALCPQWFQFGKVPEGEAGMARLVAHTGAAWETG